MPTGSREYRNLCVPAGGVSCCPRRVAVLATGGLRIFAARTMSRREVCAAAPGCPVARRRSLCSCCNSMRRLSAPCTDDACRITRAIPLPRCTLLTRPPCVCSGTASLGCSIITQASTMSPVFIPFSLWWTGSTDCPHRDHMHLRAHHGSSGSLRCTPRVLCADWELPEAHSIGNSSR